MKYKCIDTEKHNRYITIGKIYEVIEDKSTSDLLVVINDADSPSHYKRWKFERQVVEVCDE